MTIPGREATNLKSTTHNKDVTQTLSHYVIKAALKARRKNNVYKIPSRRQLLHRQHRFGVRHVMEHSA